MKNDVITPTSRGPKTSGIKELTTAQKARLVMHAMGIDKLGSRIPESASTGATDKPLELPQADESQINQILLEFAKELGNHPQTAPVPVPKRDDTHPATRSDENDIAGRMPKVKPARAPEQSGHITSPTTSARSKIANNFHLANEHPRVCAFILAHETTNRTKQLLQKMDKALAQKTVLHLLEIEIQPPMLPQDTASILGWKNAGS